MTSYDVTTRRLPFLQDFSAQDRERADKAAKTQEQRQAKADRARAQKLEAALEDHRRRRHDLLGAKKTAQLRDAIRDERLAFRAALQPPEGLERDRTKLEQASRRRIRALTTKLGAPPDKVKKLRDKYTAAIQQIVADEASTPAPGFHLPSHLDDWVRRSPLNLHALPWGIEPLDPDPNDPHRWFLERPPWFGFTFRFALDGSSNFHADRNHILDPSAGLVGNQVSLDCDSADDDDEATATAESQIAFGFVPPVAGLVEVLIDAQSTIGTHHVSVEDEWGFSQAWALQANHLMMNVLHPNVPEPSLALLSSPFVINGEAAYGMLSEGDNYSQDHENLTRGTHYFAQLTSSGPVPAGQSVVVTVGTRSTEYGSVNDMEFHSSSDFQWFLSSIQVRIAP